MIDLNRFQVRTARKNKMKVFVIVDTEKKSLVRKIRNSDNKKVEYFFSNQDADSFVEYLVDCMLFDNLDF